MNIQHPVLVVAGKFFRQDAHEASQNQQIGGKRIDLVAQGGIERFPVRKGLVIDDSGFNASRLGQGEACCIGTIRYDSGNAYAGNRGIGNRLHVAAGSGYQNDKVFHGICIKPGVSENNGAGAWSHRRR
jgi:hypothetical protein